MAAGGATRAPAALSAGLVTAFLPNTRAHRERGREELRPLGEPASAGAELSFIEFGNKFQIGQRGQHSGLRFESRGEFGARFFIAALFDQNRCEVVVGIGGAAGPVEFGKRILPGRSRGLA